ncbi:MAG: methionyl-tRNA formyltransferase [Clostridia bacterium]|nr:methionyl-tRNA formyltransferase [Clostridia bacterium]
MRIAFLGTPEFALPVLQMLIDRPGVTLAVFTQPDRPVGRKAILTPPPVKQLAERHGIPVFQFEKIRSEEGVAALEAFAPDLMVTAAFGQLLGAKNLAVPKFGTINVHGSLLPSYRGASPIQTAILNGDRVTGVTTMFTDIGMDTGDMLLRQEVEIAADDTYETLSEKLSVVGASLLSETLDRLEAGTLTRIPQNNAEATVCHLITKQDGKIDFAESVKKCHDRIRAMNPWPVAYAMLDGQPLKLYEAAPSDLPLDDASCGTLKVVGKKLYVRCLDGYLNIRSLQCPGKKRMSAESYLCGCNLDGKQLV